MNWAESRALTPLKRDFLLAFFARDQDFFLTGGSALGIFYLQHRRSYDLDLFTTKPIDWHLLGNRVRAVAAEIGADCHEIAASPEFGRYEIRREGERELLDFVAERMPQVDVQKSAFGQVRVDTLREILVNKICTLIHRCEMKDLVDLYFLQREGYRILEHFETAREKEGGLEPAMIAFLLSQVKVEVPEYLLAPIDEADFAAFVRDLQRQFAELSFPK